MRRQDVFCQTPNAPRKTIASMGTDTRYTVSSEGAEILLRAKEMSDWTFEKLASRLGTDVATVHAVLHGEQQTCTFLPELCKFLDVNIYEVMPLKEGQRRALRALDSIRESWGDDGFEEAVRNLERQAQGSTPKPTK